MKEDELELDTLGEKKTALFIVISDTDYTFNFVVAMMYTQLFNLLCDKADVEKYLKRKNNVNLKENIQVSVVEVDV